MKRYVELAFRNAALPITVSKLKDFVSDNQMISGERYMNRSECERYKKSIINFYDKDLTYKLVAFEPVSNMLHVMMGLRPVSTFKSSGRKRHEGIDRIAETAVFRIENITTYFTDNGEERLITNFTKSDKSVQNTNKQKIFTNTEDETEIKGYVTWSYFKKRHFYSENEKYESAMNKFREWYGSDTFNKDYTFIDFLKYLANEKGLKEEMISFFKTEFNGIGIYTKIIEGGTDVSSFNHCACGNPSKKYSPEYKSSNNNYNLAKLVEAKGTMHKTYLNGSFIVTIDDDELYEALMNGPRYATYLDDGFIRIKSVSQYMDLYEKELQGYKKVTYRLLEAV